MSGDYRPLTDWERRLLWRLLEPAFPGQVALRQQLEDIVGSAIDENGSLDLESEGTMLALVETRVPTEGEATDRDGTTIHYLLHVVAGKLKELEIFKEDASSVVQHPPPEDVEVFALPSQ